MSTGQDDKHVYDGITELDNPMPGWWVATFFATIVFSYFYLVSDSPTVGEAYAEEVRIQAARDAEAALALGEVTEDSLKTLTRDAATMAAARTQFGATCAVCHGDRGQGLIGPNLTDGFWKNGDGELVTIHHIIDGGVPTRGMPAWGKQLDPIAIRKLAAFVGTLRGTNAAGGKAPEGHEIAVRQ